MADNLHFSVNISEISSQFKEMKDQIEEALMDGVKGVASMTHAKTLEFAQRDLKSTRNSYIKAMQPPNGFQEIAPGIWVVSLNESALWIEEGQDPHSLVDTMLKKNAKISKDGNRYRVIPFEHSKSPELQTQQGADLVNQIRGHLKKQNIPFRGIERDAKGEPKMGRLHKMDIPGRKLKPTHTAPPLHGLTIYQSKGPGGKVRRDILTFRTISDKHKQQGKWFHPGLEPRKFMDKALDWAMNTWEREILPGILGRF